MQLLGCLGRHDISSTTTDVHPDNRAAIDFLGRWAPEGPWLLTAIATDKKSIETRTFGPNEIRALEEWLRTNNGQRNIYFSVNPPLRGMSKKAEKEDIKEARWLHVDIDPRAGEDIALERQRALELLTVKLPMGVPPPTVVVFSGGGYQGFWALAEPFPIEGETARAEEFERYNRQLELLFRADRCHNVDRIMRLPGTINIPDVRKAKKGRVPTLATLTRFGDQRYPLSAFTPAPAVQSRGEPFGLGNQAQIKVSGNIERVLDLAELDKWNVPDRVKIVIAQGRHPEEQKEGDNSRSAWLFDALCNLARCEVPDDVMFSIVTDSGWGISESVLDKGSNAEKYALRQIERAKDHAIDPWLRELNERFAIIGNIGGKCRVVEEVFDPSLKRPRLTRQSFEDFRNRYCNRFTQQAVNGKIKNVPVGAFWLHHPRHRQYDTIVFSPGHETPKAYNMWRGFGCESRPGDCSLFLGHIRQTVCSGDEEIFEYVMSWMARAVQHPDTPGEVALVLRGGKGVGKSVFAREFGKLFGRHFLHVSNPSHLVGNFNSHLRDAVVLFADEAFYAGDKKHASMLKTLVTEETIVIEAKGIDAESAPNYVHLIMASNDEHVVPASGDERRFLVLDVGTKYRTDCFAAMLSQLNTGGREALLHILMTRDIGEFDVRRVPQTAALQDQKQLSMTPFEEWWFQKLDDGQLLPGDERWERYVQKDLLLRDYCDSARNWNLQRRGNQVALGKFLSRVCPGLTVSKRNAEWEEPGRDGTLLVRRGRRNFYELPTLEEARAKWVELHGPVDWTHIDDTQPSPF
jgi:hypothetical protein